jgi:sulfoxide reductase heme-binding subunit YedZ
MTWLRRNWLSAVVHLGALVPLGLLAADLAFGAFVADPVREGTTRTGRVAILMLVLTLACRPLHSLTGYGPILGARRFLGLYTFFYVCLHFAIFAVWDYRLNLPQLVPAILNQRFVVPGVGALLTMVPLALTSCHRMQQRMGRGWRRLHRLFYLAAILDVMHFAWLAKDLGRPLRYGVAVGGLLLLRIPTFDRGLRKLRRFVPGP